VTLTLRIQDAAIAVDGVWDWVSLIYNEGDLPPMDTAYAPVYSLTHYSGRVLPAVEMSMHRTTSHRIAYALEVENDRARLVGMLGQIVWYRRGGRILRGLLTSIGENVKWWGWAEALTIEEVSTGAPR